MNKSFFAAAIGITALALVGCNDDVTPTGSGDTDDVSVLAGNIVVEPCSIDFGVLQAGESVAEVIKLKNTGLGDLQILNVELEAPFSAAFNPPKGITPDGESALAITFAPGPDDFGLSSSELIVTSDDPDNQTVVCALSGTVTDDADLDGFAAISSGGTDCDDNNPDINPGAEEVWYDGVDQNCSGDSDYDQDGDGYEASFYFPSAGTVNPISGLPGGDCQDVYDFINPGQEEVWYDGTDADCDGQNDFDRDGDGYRTAEFGFNDCNDDDPLANPEAIEAFNGADDDCNGLVDDKASPERADRIAYGDDDDWSVGHGIAMDDVDGSGVTDVLVGCHYYDYKKTGATTGDAPGGVAIFWDNGLEDQDYICDGDEDLFIEGDSATDELGFEVITLPDFNGGGVADFAVSARGYDSFAGAVYVFAGEKLSTSTTLESYDVKLTGLRGYALGSGMGTGDLNGDGISDLIMHGASPVDVYTYTAVHYGAKDGLGEYEWNDIDATFFQKCGTPESSTYYLRSCGNRTIASSAGYEPGAKEAFDFNGHAPADFDGDGYDDFVFGDAWSDDGGPTQSGSVWALFGRRADHTSANAEYKDAMTVIANGGVKDGGLGGGVGFMPDIDGDGADEMIIHDDDRSSIYLMMGGQDIRSGYEDLEGDAAAIFRGVSAFSGMTNAGDWDGDGVGDVVLTFGEGTGGGSLYLLPSQEWSGEYDFDEVAAGSVIGDAWNYSFGASAPIYTRPLNPLSEDGTFDLIVGDWRYDNEDLTKGGAEGGVFVFYNQNK